MKKISLWVSGLLLIVLQSCSVNTETTYYNDSASSMESNILIDKGMLSMMNMMNNGSDKAPNFSNLSTDWKSLYDLQKDGLITLNKDSVKVLHKMFLKLNKDKGEIYGVSLKYDKLLPAEVTTLLSQSKELQRMPLQNIATWNGKTLTIDTDKFNSVQFLNKMENVADNKESATPANKSDSIAAYGQKMAENMVGMMKMFPVNFSNTIKFQKPIKSIVGKHDFVKQIDKKTIQINLRSNDLLDEKNALKDKDKKIIITTE
ncbi:hypothetical protein [Kaistella carnis]|uniref:hypothetical protein n=1 Tax=Kaistella carnis TaxID=1241979 RepID=UPI002898EAFA|nr:hypothetical protein [Kaistella carnis]